MILPSGLSTGQAMTVIVNMRTSSNCIYSELIVGCTWINFAPANQTELNRAMLRKINDRKSPCQNLINRIGV